MVQRKNRNLFLLIFLKRIWLRLDVTFTVATRFTLVAIRAPYLCPIILKIGTRDNSIYVRICGENDKLVSLNITEISYLKVDYIHIGGQ